MAVAPSAAFLSLSSPVPGTSPTLTSPDGGTTFVFTASGTYLPTTISTASIQAFVTGFDGRLRAGTLVSATGGNWSFTMPVGANPQAQAGVLSWLTIYLPNSNGDATITVPISLG